MLCHEFRHHVIFWVNGVVQVLAYRNNSFEELDTVSIKTTSTDLINYFIFLWYNYENIHSINRVYMIYKPLCIFILIPNLIVLLQHIWILYNFRYYYNVYIIFNGIGLNKGQFLHRTMTDIVHQSFIGLWDEGYRLFQ